MEPCLRTISPANASPSKHKPKIFWTWYSTASSATRSAADRKTRKPERKIHEKPRQDPMDVHAAALCPGDHRLRPFASAAEFLAAAARSLGESAGDPTSHRLRRFSRPDGSRQFR